MAKAPSYYLYITAVLRTNGYYRSSYKKRPRVTRRAFAYTFNKSSGYQPYIKKPPSHFAAGEQLLYLRRFPERQIVKVFHGLFS